MAVQPIDEGGCCQALRRNRARITTRRRSAVQLKPPEPPARASP
jgi:hypothetical protein